MKKPSNAVEPNGVPAPHLTAAQILKELPHQVMKQVKITTRNQKIEVYNTERIVLVPEGLTQSQIVSYIKENELHSKWYLHEELVSEIQTYFINDTDETFEIVDF